MPFNLLDVHSTPWEVILTSPPYSADLGLNGQLLQQWTQVCRPGWNYQVKSCEAWVLMCDNAQDIDGTLVAESLRKGRGGYGERE